MQYLEERGSILLPNIGTSYMYVNLFQNVFLRCPTPRLHCFLSSHWPSFKFLSFMAFLIPSIQFFFGLPRALFCFGYHFNTILGNLPSAILWTWPYHVSWFYSISFIIVSSNPICCLIVTFLIFSFLDWNIQIHKIHPHVHKIRKYVVLYIYMHVKQIGAFGDYANATKKKSRWNVNFTKIVTSNVRTLCVLSILLEVFVWNFLYANSIQRRWSVGVGKAAEGGGISCSGCFSSKNA